MPRKRITFIVIPPNDGQVQEFRFSSKLLWMVGMLLVMVCCAFGYYVSGYHSRVDQYSRLADLRHENDDLTRALQTTRKTVAELEDVMTDLAQDDRKLRSLHNMDEDELLGGMGGNSEPGTEADLPEVFSSLPERKRSLIEDMNGRIFRLQMRALYHQHSFSVIDLKYRDSEEGRQALPTISPVPKDWAWKTSGFGRRTDPFTGLPARHNGIDLAGRKGTKVVATADGNVIFAYHDIRLGNVVVINHDLEFVSEAGETGTRPGTYRTEYGHLDKMFVKKGDRVTRRQQIGVMGSTGKSTGPHLHYAVRYRNRREYLDPEDFLLDWPADDRVAGWLSAKAGE